VHKPQLIRTIPSLVSEENTKSALLEYGKNWFYDFIFSNGASTFAPDEITGAIHRTRAELILPLLDSLFDGKWHEIRCLDIACHQGWFATQVALRGAQEVIGIDIREEHIDMATTIKNLSCLKNIAFRKQNLFDLSKEPDEKFDLTLFLGILYHLDNPLEALSLIRSLTRQICIIESQIARSEAELECLWGSGAARKGPGIAIVPSDECHVEGNRRVVLVPSLKALYAMLQAAGFDRLYLCVPHRTACEQYRNYDRVVLIASVL